MLSKEFQQGDQYMYFLLLQSYIFIKYQDLAKIQHTNVPHCLNVVSVKAAINRLENCKPDSSPV